MNAGKIAMLLELAPVVVPKHSRPVIQALQREMDVLIGFELYYRKPAFAGAGEYVNHGAIGSGESRHLRIHVRRIEPRIYRRDAFEDQRLKPAFGINSPERITTVAG